MNFGVVYQKGLVVKSEKWSRSDKKKVSDLIIFALVKKYALMCFMSFELILMNILS